MTITPTAIPDVLLIEPTVFEDDRGLFFESYNHRTFAEAARITQTFVQDNQSGSKRHVLRGLHYQLGAPQGKLVRTVAGEVFDVAVDLRRHSPSFGRWVGTNLSSANRRQLWIPGGFAHGFLVLSDWADVAYKATDFYAPAEERILVWNDPAVGVDWPLSADPILNARDRAGRRLAECELFP
jgi:dTDP-4-dehydrorhamnose 3,5-epimerase